MTGTARHASASRSRGFGRNVQRSKDRKTGREQTEDKRDDAVRVEVLVVYVYDEKRKDKGTSLTNVSRVLRGSG
jgi:hypothetical protein